MNHAQCTTCGNIVYIPPMLDSDWLAEHDIGVVDLGIMRRTLAENKALRRRNLILTIGIGVILSLVTIWSILK